MALRRKGCLGSVIALLLLLALAGYGAHLGWKRKLPSTGGLYFPWRVELAVPSFRQGDERWREDLLGGVNGTLGEEGCAVASAAMIMKSYGVDTDPQRLNDFLTTHQGLCRQRLAGILERAAEFTPGVAEKAYEDLPSYWLIDSQLLAAIR